MASLTFSLVGPDAAAKQSGEEVTNQSDEEVTNQSDEEVTNQSDEEVKPLPISSDTSSPSLSTPENASIQLARGEILAFRVNIQVKSEKQEKVEVQVQKFSGSSGSRRHP